MERIRWGAQAQLPNRPAANNLIEGSLAQVLDLLERLTFGDDEAAKTEWRAAVRVMQARRRGKPIPPSLPEQGESHA